MVKQLFLQSTFKRKIVTLLVMVSFLVQLFAPSLPINQVEAATTNFSTGSLIIPMDTTLQNYGMWKAYGLVYNLLANGIPVHWAISDSKTFGVLDFTAHSKDLRTQGDQRNNYSFTGGPFVIDSAYAAAAKPLISAWWARSVNGINGQPQPAVREATDGFSSNVDIVLKSPPRIANEATNAGIAITYYNAAGIPDLNGNAWTSTSPNILTQTMIANGALFTQGDCSQRKFDIFVTPHNGGYSYSLTDPANLGTRTYAQLDYFVHQGGGWTALCHSILSNENAIANLYLNSSPSVKALFKASGGGGFLTKKGFGAIANVGGTWTVTEPTLPLTQAVPTTVAQALPGGSVQTWLRTSVQYHAQTELAAHFRTASNLIYDWGINGVAHDGTTLGKVTFLGGHSYATSLPYSGNFEAPYLRFFYNSLFFNGSAVAKLDLTTTPDRIPLGKTSEVIISLINSGSSTAISPTAPAMAMMALLPEEALLAPEELTEETSLETSETLETTSTEETSESSASETTESVIETEPTGSETTVSESLPESPTTDASEPSADMPATAAVFAPYRRFASTELGDNDGILTIESGETTATRATEAAPNESSSETTATEAAPSESSSETTATEAAPSESSGETSATETVATETTLETTATEPGEELAPEDTEEQGLFGLLTPFLFDAQSDPVPSQIMTVTLAPGVTYLGMVTGYPAPLRNTTDSQGRTILEWDDSLGNIPGNTTALQIRVSITPTTLGELKIAHLEATYGDVYGENFTADLCRAITVYNGPAPEISKTPDSQTLYTGQVASWDLNYRNTGIADLLNAVVEDILPAGLSYRSATPAPLSIEPMGDGRTRILWNVGTLPANSTTWQTIRLTAYVNAGTSFTNTVALSGSDASGYLYRVEDTAVVTITTPPISLVKSVSPTGAVDLTNPGQVLTYTLRPSYIGDRLLQDVLVSDPVPAYTTYVASSANAGGIYGFTPLAAVNGVDSDTFASPRTTTVALSAAPTTTAQDGTVTVSMTITNNSGAAITNIKPEVTELLGGAERISGPSATGFNLANGGSQTVTYTFKMTVIGERRFTGTAVGTVSVADDYTFADGLSSTVLVVSRLNATPANDLVTWRLGSNTAGVPGETITSGYTAGVYAFRGSNTREFSKYGFTTAAWTTRAQPTNGIEKGGSLTNAGGGILYASEGNSKWFYSYNIATNAWTRLADSSDNFNEGGSIQYLEVGGVKYVYALLGNSNRFRRFNISNLTWAPTNTLANTPENIKKGGALTTDGTYLYALRGDTKPDFYRYNIATNTWEARAPTPGNVGWGGALTRIGNYIYAFQGDGKTGFWRYDIAANSWSAMANAPGNVGDGGSLTNDGTNLFALQGKTRAYWQYTVASNTWSLLPTTNFTGNVGQGGAVVYDPGLPPTGRFSAMRANASLLTGGDEVSFTLTVSSSTSVSGVAASTPTITTTNGVSLTLKTGPTVINGDSTTSSTSDPVTIQWTYTVNAGSTPGTVTFTAGATGTTPSTTFPAASSRSVIVTPPLTYQVRIHSSVPSGVSEIVNFGMISDTAALGAGVNSNATITPLRRPRLTLAKQNSPNGAVRPGDEITYTLVLNNTGDGIAQNVLFEDVIPTHTSYVAGSATISGGLSPPTLVGGKLTTTIPTLAAGGTVTLTFKVKVNETGFAVGTYTIANTASATAAGYPTVNSNTTTNTLTIRAAFGVLKSADPDVVTELDQVVTYTITVYNTGDVPLTAVTVVDPMLTDLQRTSGDTNTDNKLDLDEIWIYTGTYTVTAGDIDEYGLGHLFNTATADTGETDPQDATAEVEIRIEAATVHLKKLVLTPGSPFVPFTIRVESLDSTNNPDGRFRSDVLLMHNQTLALKVPFGKIRVYETAIPLEYEFDSAVTALAADGPYTPYTPGNFINLNTMDRYFVFTNKFRHATYFHNTSAQTNQFFRFAD